MSARALGMGLLVACALACTALVPQRAQAGDGNHGGGYPPLLRLLEDHAAELGLTDDELAHMRAIVTQAQARARDHRERLRAERTALENLLAQASDSAAVLRQVDVVSRIESEMFKDRVKLLMELRSRFSEQQLSDIGLRADAWLTSGGGRGRGSKDCDEGKQPEAEPAAAPPSP